MMLWPVLALALAAADGPISTNLVARPPDPPPASAPQPAGPPAAATQILKDVPASAPKDDYGFVAWCHGALQGHMDLYDDVRDELNKVSPGNEDIDKQQMAAGKSYLALYERAMKAAEKYSPGAAHERGLTDEQSGRRIWSAARAAEPRTRMWSWLMWELPPACETTAKRLEKDAPLLGQALRNAPAAPSATAADSDDPSLTSAGLRGPR